MLSRTASATSKIFIGSTFTAGRRFASSSGANYSEPWYRNEKTQVIFKQHRNALLNTIDNYAKFTIVR
uniref:Uncharacterized protein n=1 Tax=Romanomermis culicivorax TaxID=13658 RepID=A0A915I697_ROMCU